MANAIIEAAKSADNLTRNSRNEEKLGLTGSMDFVKPAIKPQFRPALGDM